MKQTVILRDIYAADLFTRSRASELRTSINVAANEVELDFNNISFMSRSFADELCNIMDEMSHINFSFINMCDEIKTMLNKVQNSRRQERKRGVANAKIIKFDNIESLSEYFITMV